MSQTNLLKLLEVGVLLLALGVFVWWQMRDLKRARQATARERALEAKPSAASPLSDASNPPSPSEQSDPSEPLDPSVPPRNPPS